MMLKTMCTLVLVFIAKSAFAGFGLPTQIMVTTLGSAEFQIKPYEAYPIDKVPSNFYVFADNKVAVSNAGLVKTFDGDSLQSIFDKNIEANFVGKVFLTEDSIVLAGSKKSASGKWRYDLYYFTYEGVLLSKIPKDIHKGRPVKVLQNGNVIIKVRGQYSKYTPTGELLATYNEKPLGLGIAKQRSIGGEEYITTIQYEDITYVVDGYVDNYLRDQNDFLYSWQSYTTTDPVSQTDSTASKIWKYGPCGKSIGTLVLPTTEYEPVTAEEMENGAGVNWVVRNEYGLPVIGPDGSVYAYKRTPDTYGILKWEWVDDPSDPKPGPDSPATTRALPSTSGIHLSWEASTQDPGCVDGYEVERATSADGIFELLTTVEKGKISYSDTTASSGNTWYYRVKAKAGELESDPSPVTSATRP